MRVFRTIIEGALAGALVVLLGYIGMGFMFSDYVPSRARVGLFPVGGLHVENVLKALNVYEQEFARTKVTITFRGVESVRTFQELGVELKKEETAKRIRALARPGIGIRRTQIIPAIAFHDEAALRVLEKDFAGHMVIPQHQTLVLGTQNTVHVLPAKSGERIDMISLGRDITEAFSRSPMRPIAASAVRAVPETNEVAIEAARVFAQSLLRLGFRVTVPDQEFHIPIRQIADMMVFTHTAGPIVQFDKIKLEAYLKERIVPKVQQDPVNARFQVADGKVIQFALPQDGRTVNMEETMRLIAVALEQRTQIAPIALEVARPLVSDMGDGAKLGITTLLAVGESDFRGSPKNRVHNVEVGASKYNGILIAPNEEFSFNRFLGPVDKEAGFLPELVIKKNVTTPEFGGGLCQVSSTVFRAAVHSGMKITSRRNHSYAVRYYGTPGFDATIYPPYTDFRFLNNTPGYILIQTKIEGTKLSFEFWGTDDNRTVVVDGPHPYNKRPDGSVKAVLKQTVTKDGQALIEDTFMSNYRSPNLFPQT